MKRHKNGFTLIEVLVVLALGIALSTVAVVMLFGRRNVSALNDTAREIATQLREAQASSASQLKGSQWGVAFNNTSTPYFALFYGQNPDPANFTSFKTLPSTVRYYDPGNNASRTIGFSQISGSPFASDGSLKVVIYLEGNINDSSTISVLPTGAIAYDLLECSITAGCVKTTVYLGGFNPQGESGGGGKKLRGGGSR